MGAGLLRYWVAGLLTPLSCWVTELMSGWAAAGSLRDWAVTGLVRDCAAVGSLRDWVAELIEAPFAKFSAYKDVLACCPQVWRWGRRPRTVVNSEGLRAWDPGSHRRPLRVRAPCAVAFRRRAPGLMFHVKHHP